MEAIENVPRATNLGRRTGLPKRLRWSGSLARGGSQDFFLAHLGCEVLTKNFTTMIIRGAWCDPRFVAALTIHFICTGNMYRSRLAEAYCASRHVPGVQPLFQRHSCRTQ
jgi:hypothetical protein